MTKPTETVSLAEVLDSVRSSFQKEVEERQLTISTEVADRPVLLGNPDHFRLLWSQLLSNAIQYTPNGGRITLSLKTDSHERQVQGTVSDTGIGIATEEIPRIFEVFYRSEAAKSIKETGTGLGLSIVQQILSLYGGTIEIDSTPGKGSSFRFTLPQSTRTRRRSSLIPWLTSLLGWRLRKVLIASFCLLAGLTVGLNALVIIPGDSGIPYHRRVKSGCPRHGSGKGFLSTQAR